MMRVFNSLIKTKLAGWNGIQSRDELCRALIQNPLSECTQLVELGFFVIDVDARCGPIVQVVGGFREGKIERRGQLKRCFCI